MRVIPLVLAAVMACASASPAMPTDTRIRYEEATQELDKLYQTLMARLKKTNPPAAVSLRVSERKWIEFRDLECKFQGEALSVAGIPAVTCLETMVLQRIAALKKVTEILDIEEEPEPVRNKKGE